MPEFPAIRAVIRDNNFSTCNEDAPKPMKYWHRRAFAAALMDIIRGNQGFFHPYTS